MTRPPLIQYPKDMLGAIGRYGVEPPDPGPGASLVADATLRSMARPRPLLATPATRLCELVYRMSQDQEEAAVVADPDTGLPLGLVTLRELLHAISFQDGGLDDPIAAHMIGAPLTLSADAPVHRAKVMMAKRKVGHLLLTESDGRLLGLVTQADLLGLRTGGAATLIDAIGAARDLDAMARAADQVRRRGAELFQSGMGVEALCQWISGLRDLIAMRIVELIEDEYDLPGVPWCWMVFGSEGRLEQTFVSDQDNGLLFVPPTPESTAAVREAFLPFAQAVNRALHHCGIERCRGKIMAGNPEWCLSAAEWQQRFARWMDVPDPQALLHATIFFDFRPLYGSTEAVDRLRDWLLAEAPRHPRFFHGMATQALSVAPPLGLAGRIACDRNRAFPGTVDLKVQGARYFMDAARLFALRHGVWITSTAERLRAVGAARGRSSVDTVADVEAFHLIQRFRMQRQLESRTLDDANRVDPKGLSTLHRLMLTEALKQARKLQASLRQEFVV